jgi:hypothetical protein
MQVCVIVFLGTVDMSAVTSKPGMNGGGTWKLFGSYQNVLSNPNPNPNPNRTHEAGAAWPARTSISGTTRLFTLGEPAPLRGELAQRWGREPNDDPGNVAVTEDSWARRRAASAAKPTS